MVVSPVSTKLLVLHVRVGTICQVTILVMTVVFSLRVVRPVMLVSVSSASIVRGTSSMGLVANFATNPCICAVDVRPILVWHARSVSPSTIVSACPAPSS